jgi:hypothetical protein
MIFIKLWHDPYLSFFLPSFSGITRNFRSFSLILQWSSMLHRPIGSRCPSSVRRMHSIFVSKRLRSTRRILYSPKDDPYRPTSYSEQQSDFTDDVGQIDHCLIGPAGTRGNHGQLSRVKVQDGRSFVYCELVPAWDRQRGPQG